MTDAATFDPPWPLTPAEEAFAARGFCPWGGGPLIRRLVEDGPPDPAGAIRSCPVCDCWGFADPTTGEA